MKAKYVKYLIKGVLADAREKFDAELKKTEARSDLRYEWWQEEENKRKALEEEVKALKAELAEAKAVIVGYKDSAMANLGLKEDGADAESV